MKEKDLFLREERINLYGDFCKTNYVPIYSQPWWMDIVSASGQWDVWLCESGGSIVAAMPYYMEQRGKYKYITKAPLTQNNGIIFSKDPRRGDIAEAKFQEKVINAANRYIETLGLDVYEQQYHHSFKNWMPFFWENYTCILRYSYIIEDTSDMDVIWNRFTPECRQSIRKGQRLSSVSSDIDKNTFYIQHEKIFTRQQLECPFSFDFWDKLYDGCIQHNSGKMLCSKDENGTITSLIFLVWDDKYVYHLLGGSVPEYRCSQSYYALIYHAIKMAHEMGLGYDFEGSMIQRIAKSFRTFGAYPVPYYRIRKVYNPEIIMAEAKDYCLKIENEKCNLKI